MSWKVAESLAEFDTFMLIEWKSICKVLPAKNGSSGISSASVGPREHTCERELCCHHRDNVPK